METTQTSLDHLTWENPMGEARKDALRLDFDHKLKLEFHGTKVTSDAGLLAYRELDEALGLTSAIDSELRDNRTGKNTRHSIAALLRTLQVKLIKIGAKVVKHSRYVIFQMAEVVVSKSLFHEILERIGHLKPVPIGSG